MEDNKEKSENIRSDNLASQPDDVLILRKLGHEYYQAKDWEKAIESFKQYVQKAPGEVVIYNIISNCYRQIDEFETLQEQIEYCEKALEVDPNYAQAVRNLIFAYQKGGNYNKAVEYFKRLFELNPVPDDYSAYGCLQIRLGNFEEGWKYYEARFSKMFGPTVYPKIDKPRWQGEEIKDKVLLVQYEQGFGDTIQFFKYLQLMKPYVKKIIFRVQDELVDLLKINADDIEIVGMLTELDELVFDYHLPLMSIFNTLKLKKDDISKVQACIKADEKKVEQYRKEFFDNDCLKIGISWHGMALGNARRNIPLRCFCPLARLKNVKVYSFQKDAGYNQLANLPEEVEIVDLGKTFRDFSDTAAAMANLDLFVTSDNVLLNLAGSMCKKTFVMLNKHCEWRWFFDEETTPWYNSVKIFKKKHEEDNWNLLIQSIIQEELASC